MQTKDTGRNEMNLVVVYPSKQRRNHFICKRFCGKEESHFGDKKSIL